MNTFNDEISILLEKWSNKYKKSINCKRPKGFRRRHIVPEEKRNEVKRCIKK